MKTLLSIALLALTLTGCSRSPSAGQCYAHREDRGTYAKVTAIKESSYVEVQYEYVEEDLNYGTNERTNYSFSERYYLLQDEAARACEVFPLAKLKSELEKKINSNEEKLDSVVDQTNALIEKYEADRKKK